MLLFLGIMLFLLLFVLVMPEINGFGDGRHGGGGDDDQIEAHVLSLTHGCGGGHDLGSPVREDGPDFAGANRFVYIFSTVLPARREVSSWNHVWLAFRNSFSFSVQVDPAACPVSGGSTWYAEGAGWRRIGRLVRIFARVGTRKVLFPAMLTDDLQRFSWKVLQPILIIGFAAFTALVISVKAELAVLLFEGSLLLLTMALAKADECNLVIAFILTDHICQFFKRFIYLWGPQSHPLYYALQLLPDVFIATAMLLIFRKTTRTRISGSSKMLLGFFGVSLLTSAINAKATTLQAGLGGFHQGFMLLSALFVGMMLPLTFLSRLSRVFTALIFISVPYGLYQFFFGPTAMDRAWAEALHESSIEAGKVWESMTISGAEFRVYSYYADHTTWGLFLALALVAIIMASTLGMFPRKRLWIVIPVALVGLVVCQTRTPWLAFLGSLIVYRLITTRLLRRPMLLILGVLSSFAVVVTAGDYVARNVSVGVFSNSLLSRYATVGTITARTSAWKLFARNLPVHWLLGTGFGYGTTDRNVSLGEEVYSHNMYVELLVTTGLPGLLLFLGFFYRWITEAFWIARVGSRDVSRAALWSISLAVGMLLTGSVQGTNFMNIYLCLMLGITSGEWRRLKTPAPVPIAAAQWRWPRAISAETPLASPSLTVRAPGI